MISSIETELGVPPVSQPAVRSGHTKDELLATVSASEVAYPFSKLGKRFDSDGPIYSSIWNDTVE